MADLDFDEDLDAVEAAILADEEARRGASRRLPTPEVGSDGGAWRLADGSPLEGEVTSVEGRTVKARHVSSCHRCSGRGGSDAWPGWTCFRCGGSTVDRRTVRLYAPHQVDAIAVAKARRRAELERERIARAAERAAGCAERVRVLLDAEPTLFDRVDRLRVDERGGTAADVLRSVLASGFMSDAQRGVIARTCDRLSDLDEDRRTSRPVGAPGDRFDVEVTCQRVRPFVTENAHTFRSETKWLAAYRDRTGAVYLNVSGSRPAHEAGDVVTVRGTVKCHKDYDGVTQTVLTRLKVLALVRTASRERALAACEAEEATHAPSP